MRFGNLVKAVYLRALGDDTDREMRGLEIRKLRSLGKMGIAAIFKLVNHCLFG